MKLAPSPARQGPGPMPEEAVRRTQASLSRRVAGLLSGEHRAPGAAAGLELAQVRPYEPGDDVRRLDAAASARTGEPHVRLQVPERAMVTWLVLDLSPSMAFGSTQRLKSDVAEGVAEVVARLAVRHGGRLAVALAAGEAQVLPPRGGREALAATRALVRCGVAPDGTRGAGLQDAMARVGRLARRPGWVVVVSDFREDGWQGPLRGLATRHGVLAVEVGDPLEERLPDAGTLTLQDPETGELLDVDTGAPAVRAAFARAEQERAQRLTEDLRRVGAHRVALRTDADWLRELGRVLR